MHADLSRFGAPRIAYPDYAEPGLLLAMLDANDVAFLAHVLDPGDSGPGAGNVYGACLLEKGRPTLSIPQMRMESSVGVRSSRRRPMGRENYC